MACALNFLTNEVRERELDVAETFKGVVLDIFLDVAQDKKNEGAEPKFTRDLLAGKLLAEAEANFREQAESYRSEYRDTSLRDDDVNSLAWGDHYCDSALYIVKNYQFKKESDEDENEDMIEMDLEEKSSEVADSNQLDLAKNEEDLSNDSEEQAAEVKDDNGEVLQVLK